MVLLTGGAVVIGLLVILVASGVFTPRARVGDLLVPIYKTPTSLADPSNPQALGQANAPVTVEIFSDFQCPACKFFTTSTEAAFLDQYVATGKARFVYRDMTIIDGGDPAGESSQAAIAARCAGDQGKFWLFHDYLFENQDPAGENKGWFTQSRLQAIADAVGLDRTKFDACTSNGAAKLAAVQADTAAGKALGVSQTPTLAVDGKLLTPGAVSISTLGGAIDAALGGSPSPGTSGSPAPSASQAPSASPAPSASASATP